MLGLYTVEHVLCFFRTPMMSFVVTEVFLAKVLIVRNDEDFS